MLHRCVSLNLWWQRIKVLNHGRSRLLLGLINPLLVIDVYCNSRYTRG